MVMKKQLNSKDVVIIGSDDPDIFKPGFKYVMGGTIYTVVESYESDNTQMRQIVTGSGEKEILTLESLRKDMLEKDFKSIED